MEAMMAHLEVALHVPTAHGLREEGALLASLVIHIPEEDDFHTHGYIHIHS